MALFTSISTSTLCLSTSIRHCGPSSSSKHFSHPIIASSLSSPASPDSKSTTPNQTILSSSNDTSPNPYTSASSRPPEPPGFNYALANGNPFVRFARSAESSIERTIFDFRFLALFAVGGSLAGSLLCFLNGCVYIMDAYKVYWTSCVKGHHTGHMVLRLVEAIDVYLAGTVMLIFGMGLYGLFISNVPHDVPSNNDRALKGSSLFGMFALKERPKWMKISSLDELKTKVGHVIVMILLVKMFERSKMVQITTGLDLLSYSVCIFLSSASLYILHNLHKKGLNG
ncbi:hypothetical protein PRUPE_2G021800 [Prunus persica]|uniref:Structural constituent of ribosome n=2 Tax=Prunus persica TaxID=3760 RepID=A0A251Q9N2_PRUPE|nr:uncharacterized protein LOC18787370 [Prunus persica]ONI20541.1 hypothetical protein PRUPE_2G021800 [Prunus persica]